MYNYLSEPNNQPLSNLLDVNSQPHKPLGEILVEAGLVSMHQIEIALKEQKQCNWKIGEILANQNWIKQLLIKFLVRSDRATRKNHKSLHLTTKDFCKSFSVAK